MARPRCSGSGGLLGMSPAISRDSAKELEHVTHDDTTPSSGDTRMSRADLWANEDTAAKMCGMTPDKFKAHVRLLEGEGFPKKSTWNGLRYIPAILDFWNRQHKLEPLLESADRSNHERDGKENWG